MHRPGGPIALINNLCLFDFVKDRGGFRLRSIHPGHTLEEVRDNTAFDFETPEDVPATPLPDGDTLAILRGSVAARIAEVYPVLCQGGLRDRGRRRLTPRRCDRVARPPGPQGATSTSVRRWPCRVRRNRPRA